MVVRNAQPVGGVKHVPIAQGEQVLLIVRSDVEDEVHLHGYDLAAEVAPGQPAQIRFRADDARRVRCSNSRSGECRSPSSKFVS